MASNGIKLNNFASFNENIASNKILPQSQLYVNRLQCQPGKNNVSEPSNIKVMYDKNRSYNNYSHNSKETYKNYYVNNNNLNEIIEETDINQNNEIYTNIKKSYVNIDSNNRNLILYPNSNSYEIDLNKSYTNVKQISIVSSEFPNTSTTIENYPDDIRNDNIMWQNFDRNSLRIFDLLFFKDLNNRLNKLGLVISDVPNSIMQYYLNPGNNGFNILSELILEKIALDPNGLYIEEIETVPGVNAYKKRDIRSITITVKEILDKLELGVRNDPFFEIAILYDLKSYFNIYIQNILKAQRLKIVNSVLDVKRTSYYNSWYQMYLTENYNDRYNYLDGSYDIDTFIYNSPIFYNQDRLVQNMFIQIYFYNGNVNSETILNGVLQEAQYMFGIVVKPTQFIDSLTIIPEHIFNYYPLTSRIIKENYFGYLQALNIVNKPTSEANPENIPEFNSNDVMDKFNINLRPGNYNDAMMMIESKLMMDNYLQLKHKNDNFNIFVDSKNDLTRFSMKTSINLSTKRFYFRKYTEQVDVYSNSKLIKRHFVIFFYYDDHNLMENDIIEINSSEVKFNTGALKSSYDRLFNFINNKPVKAHLCKFYSLNHYNDPENPTQLNEKKDCWRDFNNFVIDIYKWENLPLYLPISHNFFYIDLEEFVKGDPTIKDYFFDIDDYGMGYQVYSGTNPDYQLKIPTQYSFDPDTTEGYINNTKVPYPKELLYDDVGPDFSKNQYLSTAIVNQTSDILDYNISVCKKTKIIYNDFSSNNILGFNSYDKPSDLQKKISSIVLYRVLCKDNVGLPRKVPTLELLSQNHQLMTNDFVTIVDQNNAFVQTRINENFLPINFNYFSLASQVKVNNDNIFQIYDYQNKFYFLNSNDQLNNKGFVFINQYIKNIVFNEQTYRYMKDVPVSDSSLLLNGNINFEYTTGPISFYDTEYFVLNNDIYRDFIIDPNANDRLTIQSIDFKRELISNMDENEIIPFQLIFDKNKYYYRYVNNQLVQVSKPSENELFNKYNGYIIDPTDDEIMSQYTLPAPIAENILYFGKFEKIDDTTYSNTFYLYRTYEDAQWFSNQISKRVVLYSQGYGRYIYTLKNLLKFNYPNHCLYTFFNGIRIANVDMFNILNEYSIYRKNKDEYYIVINQYLNELDIVNLKNIQNNFEIISDYNGHYIYCSNYSKENIPQKKINYSPVKYIMIQSNAIASTKPDLLNNYNLDEINELKIDNTLIKKVDNIFTKVSLNSSNSVVFDSYMCNSRVYDDTPINVLNKIDFKFYREDGKLMNFKNLDHAFTLEITEYIDELKNVNYSSIRGMKDTIGYAKENLCNRTLY